MGKWCPEKRVVCVIEFVESIDVLFYYLFRNLGVASADCNPDV